MDRFELGDEGCDFDSWHIDYITAVYYHLNVDNKIHNDVSFLF